MRRALPPILYILLGVGNDVYSKFKEYVQTRIEEISQGEIEALNMSLIAEIKQDELLITNDDLSTELSKCIQQRINLNARLKSRSLSHEDRNSLKELRDSKKDEVNRKRSELEISRAKLAEAKKELKSCKAVEVEAKKNNES